MTDAGRRLVGATCFLAALWVMVYWLWQPSPPAISFERDPAHADPPATGWPATELNAGASATRPAPDVGPASPPRAAIRDPLGPARTEPRQPPPRRGSEEAPDSTPGFRLYTVRAQETFESIALRELGSRSLAQAIARANPLKDPRRLQIGDVIRLPADPANIEGSPPVPGTTAPQAPSQQAASATSITYTVEPGDTLSEVSRLFYGTTRHAELIFEANRDRLRSINDVRAGQVIRIPQKPVEPPG